MLGWVIYGITVNVIAFCLMGYDKNRARTGRWRVSERKLFLVGIIGGSIGIYFGMKKFRHKTKHCSFTVGMPFIFAAQAIAVVLIIRMLSS